MQKIIIIVFLIDNSSFLIDHGIAEWQMTSLSFPHVL